MRVRLQGSGMAASITSTLLLFKTGDHIVASEDVYGGAFRVLTSVFDKWGLSVTFVDSTSLEAINAAFIRGNTRAIYLESPSNPLLKISDIAAAAGVARKRGILTIVDNTFMTPYLQRPLELGWQTLSCIAGPSSSMVTATWWDRIAVAANDELGKRLRFLQNAFGAILGPHDSWLTLRGLRTLKVHLRREPEKRRAG